VRFEPSANPGPSAGICVDIESRFIPDAEILTGQQRRRQVRPLTPAFDEVVERAAENHGPIARDGQVDDIFAPSQQFDQRRGVEVGAGSENRGESRLVRQRSRSHRPGQARHPLNDTLPGLAAARQERFDHARRRIRKRSELARDNASGVVVDDSQEAERQSLEGVDRPLVPVRRGGEKISLNAKQDRPEVKVPLMRERHKTRQVRQSGAGHTQLVSPKEIRKLKLSDRS
jgi:hypothetical protein